MPVVDDEYSADAIPTMNLMLTTLENHPPLVARDIAINVLARVLQVITNGYGITGEDALEFVDESTRTVREAFLANGGGPSVQ